MAAARGWYDASRDGDSLIVSLTGAWTVDAAAQLDARLRTLSAGGARAARFDLARLEALDTAGAWLLERTRLAFAGQGISVSVTGVAADHAPLLERVAAAGAPSSAAAARGGLLMGFLAHVGEAAMRVVEQAHGMLGFFGAIIVTLGRVLSRPARLRFTSLVSHLELNGLNAMPIVGLLSFLIGVVLAYQGVFQLRQFGAEIFTVDLVGVASLREMGILLTAIIVAGRSGSAFTAQIGTMQVNEEVDAMRTLGLDPIEVLVLPRLLALVIAVPLLTFFADMMAILGGGLMTMLVIDLAPQQFLQRLNIAVSVTHFWVGMVKAPVFAFLIAMVGCFEGLRVKGSAESVGRLTTQSVVESIFLVIVFDALFSVLFSYLDI